MKPVKVHLFRRARLIVANLLYRFSDSAVREMIDCDVHRYLKWNDRMKHESPIHCLDFCLLSYEEFRNVFYYRLPYNTHLIHLCKLFLPPSDGIEIGGEIAEGLFISHHQAVVYPERAGKNLRIGPGVVIGKNRGQHPHIGDNVYICANASVIGGVHIGDNVIVGVGSVVTRDLPSGGIYVGNPARLLRTLQDSPELYDEIL